MPMNNRRLASAMVAALLTLVGLAAVAGRASASPRAHAAAQAQITVYAAASLTDVFPKIDSTQKYSFAGSNALAAQITLGAPADVFASANMTLPNQLYAKGLCSQPAVFTRNALVIIVPVHFGIEGNRRDALSIDADRARYPDSRDPAGTV